MSLVTRAQVTSSTPQTVILAAPVVVANDSLISPFNTEDNLGSTEVSGQKEEVLGTQAGVWSQTPVTTKIRSDKVVVRKSSVPPPKKIFIALGLFLLCTCAILVFRSQIKNVF